MGKINLWLIAAGFMVIIIGFALMMGAPSGVEFNPDIFSTRRIVVGPMVAFAGFIFIIFAILYKPKNEEKGNDK
ncbi:MAG: DUF3098 domain-containing protein [Prevotellaceae bacterium]|nr:DUF3098 domain-containing protein [Prevotellaceae bacterium]